MPEEPTRTKVNIHLPLLLIAILSVGVLKGFRMTTDNLSPEINLGDRVLVLKVRYLHIPIRDGDIIAYRRDGKAYLSKVVRVERDTVWVVRTSPPRADSAMPIPRREVLGKVVYKLSLRR